MRNLKVIALGNHLMGDDGVGLEVAKKLESILYPLNIPVLSCETDVFYALSMINEDDFIFIIDAALIEMNIGEFFTAPLSNLKVKSKSMFTHDESLPFLIPFYFNNIEGFFIGISIKEVGFNIELSDELKSRLDDIVINIFEFIKSQVYKA